jgi:hypothetical protein
MAKRQEFEGETIAPLRPTRATAVICSFVDVVEETVGADRRKCLFIHL